jgi:hypothetical protein
MLRDHELIFLLFNCLIESDKALTTRENIHAKLSSYTPDQIQYHLVLMVGQEWVELFTDGARMTWQGHDHFDSELANDGENIDKPTADGVGLDIVK